MLDLRVLAEVVDLVQLALAVGGAAPVNERRSEPLDMVDASYLKMTTPRWSRAVNASRSYSGALVAPATMSAGDGTLPEAAAAKTSPSVRQLASGVS